MRIQIEIEFEAEEDLRRAMDEMFSAADRLVLEAERLKKRQPTTGARQAERKHRVAQMLEQIADKIDDAKISGEPQATSVIKAADVAVGDTLCAWSFDRDYKSEDRWHNIPKRPRVISLRRTSGSLMTRDVSIYAKTDDGDEYDLTGRYWRVLSARSKP